MLAYLLHSNGAHNVTFRVSGSKQSDRQVTATVNSISYATDDNGSTYSLFLTPAQEAALPSSVTVVVSDGVNSKSKTVASPSPIVSDIGVDTSGMTKLVLPSSNVSEGQFDISDWRALVSPRPSIFWEPGGTDVATVETVDGLRALGCRLSPERSPSTRMGAGATLAAGQTYRTVQRCYFDPGFDWGGSNEGGKLGIGLGGGSRPAGGLTQQDGFTSRTMWRTGGSLYEYVYDANTSGYGTDISLGVTAPRGQWFEVAREITMNSSAGASDGTLKVWYNGSLKINQSNRKWWGTGTPQIDSLILFTFHGGNDSSWSPGRQNHVYLAEMYYGAGTF